MKAYAPQFAFTAAVEDRIALDAVAQARGWTYAETARTAMRLGLSAMQEDPALGANLRARTQPRAPGAIPPAPPLKVVRMSCSLCGAQGHNRVTCPDGHLYA